MHITSVYAGGATANRPVICHNLPSKHTASGNKRLEFKESLAFDICGMWGAKRHTLRQTVRAMSDVACWSSKWESRNIISMCQFWEVYVEQQSSQVWGTTCELCLDAAVQCDKERFLETLVSDHLSLVSPTDILTITSLSLRNIFRLPVSTNVKLLDSKALFRGIPVKLMDIKTANTNPLYCHLELSPNGYAQTWRWGKSYKTLSLRRDESSRGQKKTTWEGLTHNRTGRVHNWIDERKVHSLKLLN